MSELNREKILAFVKSHDWLALAKAFQEGDLRWHAAEWEDFIGAIQQAGNKRHQQIFEQMAKDLKASIPESAHPMVDENIREVLERYRKACYPLAKLDA